MIMNLLAEQNMELIEVAMKASFEQLSDDVIVNTANQVEATEAVFKCMDSRS